MHSTTTISRWSAVTLAILAIGFVGSAHAQRLCDDGTRPPCNGGSGGGDVPDFGDLIYLYRNATGVPILDGNQCQQPLGFNSDLCPVSTLDCTGASPCLVPTDPATCAIDPAFAGCTREVDFGRISEARSSEAVLASQLEDVVVNLATADCITQDPAGRLVTSRVVDGVVSSGEIDSPLQNLAMYKQLIQTGSLGADASPIPLPSGALATAARALGAGSDKAGAVDVDLVVYVNQIMGLSDPATPTILGPKICINVKEEVQGVVQLVQKCFLNYGSFGYDRIRNFNALPSPTYIPGNAPQPGWFEYLRDLGTIPPTFGIAQGPIVSAVFQSDPGFTGGNIGGFAQAADDARAVINFMHNWPIPGAYTTPVACEGSGIETYDVSISSVSGLQVPTQMVDGGEGREFTVVVTNESGSPNAASGAVTVTAVAASGGAIVGSPWVFAFTDLAPGASKSWIQPFTTNLGVKTTINWTATVTAPADVNPLNNTVVATTNVKVTGRR
ncbi:MAG: hypothetical protein R2748_05855 [Bryobacterales bacterium]